MAFDRHPPDDAAAAARMIATMVGIVGILLLGSLFWSALGALVSAVGQAAQSLPIGERAAPTLVPPVAVDATPTSFAAPTLAPADVPTASTPADVATSLTPTVQSTQAPTRMPTAAPTLAPTPAAVPTPVPSGRAPWVLLPQPAPGSRVQPGEVTLEARGRGDAPITAIRLELDGGALPVSLEQRDGSTWRGSAQTRVAAGPHSARAVVTDQAGRSGAFRWTFEAGP